VIAGHLGFVLLGKGLRKDIPLWVFLAAALSPDLVRAVLILTGASDPGQLRSHSIPAVLGIAAAGSLSYLAARRDGAGAWLIALTSLSHVLADYFTGRKPTWPDGPLIGLQLYHHPALDFALETTVIVVGWLVYRRSLDDRSRASWVVWSALVVPAALQVFVDCCVIL
jgi:hypothetical protein